MKTELVTERVKGYFNSENTNFLLTKFYFTEIARTKLSKMEAQNIEDEDCIPNFENLDEEVRKLR